MLITFQITTQEVEGGNEQHEQVVDFIRNCAQDRPNIKICVSSRPHNIFCDAFEESPQILLERLTYDDIARYVDERFGQKRRLRSLLDRDPEVGSLLVETVMQKASGVFLWVKLVVQEVLFASQDGASMTEIFENVSRIPADLDDYFRRFMASIEARHRREASIFFQIALHEEDEFITLHQLSVLDISHLGSRGFDFSRQPGKAAYENFLTSPHCLQQRIDSACRRMNSRCRGLLECFKSPERSRWVLLNTDMGGTTVLSDSDEQLLEVYDYGVDFLHRSFRDFLLQEDVYRELISHTGGIFDVRLFLCQSRLAQIMCLDIGSSSFRAELAKGLTSYVMSAIGTPSLKTSPEANLIAERLQDVVEQIQVQQNDHTDTPWFLNHALEQWEREKGSFLTVAIEFDLVSYLREHLTADAIRNKLGRPILDYILMRRLHHLEEDHVVHNIDVLSAALRLGADPNQKWLGMSTFARYLLHLRVFVGDPTIIHSLRDFSATVPRLKFWTKESQVTSLRTVILLLEYNAGPLLPAAWFEEGVSYKDEFPETSVVGTDMITVADALRGVDQGFTFTAVKAEYDECIRIVEAKTRRYMNTSWQDDTQREYGP